MSVKETLWKKHGVCMIKQTSIPIRIQIENPEPTPILDDLVTKWRDSKNNPFPESDLTLRMLGVKRCEIDILMLHIACVPISWGQYMMMRAHYDKLPAKERFFCIAVSCLVETSDNHLILSFRSRTVATHQSMWHVSAAGAVSLASVQSTQGFILPILEEMEEELNILPSHVQKITQLGLCQHTGPGSANVEVCFYATVKLTAEQVLARSRDAKDTWEGRLHSFPVNEVSQMIRRDTFNPAGAATIITALGLK